MFLFQIICLLNSRYHSFFIDHSWYFKAYLCPWIGLHVFTFQIFDFLSAVIHLYRFVFPTSLFPLFHAIVVTLKLTTSVHSIMLIFESSDIYFAEMPTVPFLQYLVLFSSCKYLWFWAKCLKILFFSSKDHFVYTSMETKWKILFFKPKYLFSSSKILFSFVRGWHLWIWHTSFFCLPN